MKNSILFVAITLLYLPAFVFAQHEEHNHTDMDHSMSIDTSVVDHSMDSNSGNSSGDKVGDKIWTCSMHPQIRLKKEGNCPICNMALIPVQQDHSKGSSNASIRLDDKQLALLQLETAKVARKWVARSVRLVGQIDYDESQVKHITAWVPGRIERMFVDYTGLTVAKGDHMVSLYSPELVAAQEELVQAARSVARINNGSEMVNRSTRRTLNAAREKLKLLGLNTAQVAQIEKRGSAKNTVTVYSPIGGVVVEKHVNEGVYIQTGTRIYTIADLGNLWLNLDAYESDLAWIQYGQKVEFTAQAIPGETFKGIVSFVQPFLNEETRTVRVRVNVENADKRLKPGMFATAKVKSMIDSKGRIVGASFSDKFICPMHPEIVEDASGDCPICGMHLVDGDSLSYVSKTPKEDRLPPIVIPASAPLITGERAIVYVQRSDNKRYEAREVVLGAKADKFYTISSGLKEGEVVVTNGAFKIDADLQIRGAKSMMNPDAGISGAAGAHNH
jgi:Cu(I)/Ag(I) efflux system membrane fusion protein